MTSGEGVLYHTRGPVTLVGGGPCPPDVLADALALAPEAVAADGGGDVALPDGYRFGAVIGDLDSLRGAARLRAAGVPVHHVPEQDTTDLEKCLRLVAASLCLGVGFLGGRVDHGLAAANALVKFRGRRVVLVGPEDVMFLCPPRFAITAEAGTRVSVFPMGPVTGTLSEGLRWPVTGLALAPWAQTGTSNMALGGQVAVGFDAPHALLVLPRALLSAAVEALAAMPAWGDR